MEELSFEEANFSVKTIARAHGWPLCFSVVQSMLFVVDLSWFFSCSVSHQILRQRWQRETVRSFSNVCCTVLQLRL